MKLILSAFRVLVLLTLLTGAVYPLVVTGLAHLAFPRAANGSLVQVNGRLVGSELLAQKTSDQRYFWPRPSAADFATVPSGASNFAPTAQKLKEAIAERRSKYGDDVPQDMLTSSGSGLDPHISPDAAQAQVARVAAARGVSEEEVTELVATFLESRQLGFLGEPRLNVLRLNLALDGRVDSRP